MYRALAFAALLLAAPLPLAAQEAPVVCSATPEPLAEPWGAWRAAPRAIEAGKSVAAMPALFMGTPMTLRLAPSSALTLANTLERPLDPARHGGLATIDLKSASRVGIALSAGAWVDVLFHGVSQTSIDHEHGPDCSGIRKIVWFDLQPGTHVVQLVNSPAEVLTAMVVTVEPAVD